LVGTAILSRPCGELDEQGSVQNMDGEGSPSLPVFNF